MNAKNNDKEVGETVAPAAAAGGASAAGVVKNASEFSRKDASNDDSLMSM